MQHLPHELLNVDGKLFSTLRTLVIRPGLNAADYVAGKRRRCLDALRLYLVAYIAYIFGTMLIGLFMACARRDC